MATFSTLNVDCQGDGFASGTATQHYATLGIACQASAQSGQYLGLHSGLCVATGIVASQQSHHFTCVAACVASGTAIRHRRSVGTLCQAAAVASAESYHGVPGQDRYELFIAVDGASFDFGNPNETFTSLPHTTALTLASDKVHDLVTRRRNRWGLSSQNMTPTTLVIDATGIAVQPDPSMPVEVNLMQAAGNKGRITATYYGAQDNANAANQWLVYVTTDGSDPSFAAPIVIAMTGNLRGVRLLSYLTAALANGIQVRARVATRRFVSPDAFDSVLSPEVNVTISTTGPTAPADPQVTFFGEP